MYEIGNGADTVLYIILICAAFCLCGCAFGRLTMNSKPVVAVMPPIDGEVPNPAWQAAPPYPIHPNQGDNPPAYPGDPG